MPERLARGEAGDAIALQFGGRIEIVAHDAVGPAGVAQASRPTPSGTICPEAERTLRVGDIGRIVAETAHRPGR